MSNSKKGSLYRSLVFFTLVFLRFSSATAQNLVFNPSFSEKKGERFLFWQDYFAGPTAFYYNANSRSDTAVSFTAESYGKVPKSSTGFGGGIHMIYVRLKKQLQAGKYYRVAFNIKQADSSQLLLTWLGVGFEKSNDPAISLDLSGVNETNWSALKGFYLAKGGERYLYIGKFLGEHSEYSWNNKFPRKKYNSRWERKQDGFRYSAIYTIDNVSLEKLPHQPIFSHSGKFAPDEVFFETAEYSLSEQSKSYLLILASFLRSNSNLSITVEGFADERGNDEYNMQLSKRRAISVATFLLNHGVAKSKITPVWHGSKKAKRSPTSYHLDRKVQFEIVRLP